MSTQKHVHNIQAQWEISPDKLCNKSHEGQIFCWNLTTTRLIKFHPYKLFYFYGQNIGFWHSVVTYVPSMWRNILPIPSGLMN
jgi:hypothetical protein